LLVAINLTSNLSAVGIGSLARSSEDLFMSAGHGVAVKMLHIFGDKLWGHEPSLTLQVPDLKPKELSEQDFPELGADIKSKPKSEAAALPESTPANEEVSKSVSDIVVGQTSIDKSESNETVMDQLDQLVIHEKGQEGILREVEEEESPEEKLKAAFLAALKNHGKTLQLPVLTSNFFRNFVVPEYDGQIDLKKTKYKKLSNFLNEMVKEGFIVVKEESKGVDKITTVDMSHSGIVNFITDYKPSKTNGDQKPLFYSELQELYVVTDAVAPFFAKMDHKRGEGIPEAQIRKIVREYISQNNLPTESPYSKAYILDDTLKDICDCAIASLSVICNCIMMEMHHSYQMNASTPGNSTNKPSIQMSLATRSGNKKVTLVTNIDCYGIILTEFIKLCKEGAAASTTLVKLPNQKREVLQIQGNQIRFIYNLLTDKYKIPPKCILGLEFARSAKKSKK